MRSPQLSSFYRTCFCSSSTFFQGYVALQCLKSCWSCRWVRSIFGFMETWKALPGATSAFLSDAEVCNRPEAHSVWTCDSNQQWRNATSEFAHTLKSKIGQSMKEFFQAKFIPKCHLECKHLCSQNLSACVWKPPLIPQPRHHCCGPLSKALNTWKRHL